MIELPRSLKTKLCHSAILISLLVKICIFSAIVAKIAELLWVYASALIFNVCMPVDCNTLEHEMGDKGV